MKTFTNYSAGLRGINLKDGTTRWIEPGETAEVDPKEIVGTVPDLGKKSDAAAEADTADLDALRDQVATLTKQVEDGSAANVDLTKKLDEATKANATLTKQVEDVTKPKT
jgi:hypothetical protein